ncbi:hypothetical protein ACIGNX_13060 [Actinosynnema sp. NPDC053489]|uniref:hypothetical protein n=1 Tax=Actinosynnema sp. NPDC053489 TaxID=3363916 RepID=UPI0037C531BC
MRNSTRARLPLLLGALLCLLPTAGCVSGAAMDELGSRIEGAGYTRVWVGHSISAFGYDTVQITAYKTPATDDGTEIARLVWHTYPEEVDEVVVTLNDAGGFITKDQMLEEFGPRQLDPNPNEDTDFGDVLGWVVGIIAVLVVLIKVLGFLGRLGRRSGPEVL